MAETTELKKSDFYFDLPQELIAQDPLEDRSSSRLLVLDKNTGEISHHIFRDIIDYLHPGDSSLTVLSPLNYTSVNPHSASSFAFFSARRSCFVGGNWYFSRHASTLLWKSLLSSWRSSSR